MKKFLSIILALTMLLSQIGMIVSAQNAVTVTIGTVEADPNSTVDVYISLSNADAVKTIGINELDYDKTALTLKSAEVLIEDAMIAEWDNEKCAFAATYKENSVCNGNILKLTFEVGTSVGTKTISCNVIIKTMDDETEKEIVSEVVSGAVNVYGVVFEDKTCEYDGTNKEITVLGTLPAGATVEYFYKDSKVEGTFSAKDVGVYQIYAVVKQEGKEDKKFDATLSIEPKTITVDGLNAEDKIYDGTDNAVISGGALVGIINGDDVTAVFSENGKFADVNVGENISVIIDDIVLDGEDKASYKLVQPEDLVANITAREITVESVDLIEKTAILNNVFDADTEAVELDFDKLIVEIIEEEIPEEVIPDVELPEENPETVVSVEEIPEGEAPENGDEIPEDEEAKEISVKVTNFVLKGDKAANYIVTTEEFETTVSEEAVATVSVVASNGTITGEGKYLIGSEITLAAEADDGYKFSGWYVGEESVSTDAEYTFVIEEDIELVAKFTKKSTGGNGGGLQAGGDISKPKDDKEENKPTIVIPETPSTSTDGEKFIDLGGYDWAKDAINSLAEQGIIKGTSYNTYSPAMNITRADFAALIVRIFNLTSANEENFDDVSAADYFASELAIARNTGVVGGIGNNKFAPRNNISRQDMMVMIYRAMTKQGYELTSGEISVNDFEAVSDYAKEAVKALVANGIINGKNGNVDPMANATRAEVAVMLSRVLDFIK